MPAASVSDPIQVTRDELCGQEIDEVILSKANGMWPQREKGPRAQPHGMEPPGQLPFAANPRTRDCPVTAAEGSEPRLAVE
jgi:hypothetical protein